MNEETQVSPDVDTQIPTPVEETTQQPEVVEPENNEAEKADETPEDPRDKTVRNFQRRIDRLTAAKYQTQAEANQARQQLEQLQARLAQYEQPEQPQQQGPDPVQLAKEIARIEKVTEKANAVAKEGKAKFGKDFDQAVQVVNRDAGPMFDQWGRATPLGEVILTADSPASVLHAIGSDPDLAADLADMTPIQQARRIARLESELSKPKVPPKSNAPKGLAPLKATGSESGLSNDLSPEEWQHKFYALQKQGKSF